MCQKGMLTDEQRVLREKQWAAKLIHDRATLRTRKHEPRPPFKLDDRDVYIPDVVYLPDGGRVTMTGAKRLGITVDADGWCLLARYDRRGYDSWMGPVDDWYRRVPIRCPLCGKRVIARLFNADGPTGYGLVAHKAKGTNRPKKRKITRRTVGARSLTQRTR